jgi:signal transduction histidine kinase/CheY-like chemotaxis protein
MTVEDMLHGNTFIASISEFHHFFFPIIFGMCGAVFGLLFERNKRKKRLAEALLVHQNKNLSILLSVSEEFVLSLELSTVLQTIIEQATKLINLDTGAIYLHDEDVLYLGATTPPLPPGFPDEFRKASLLDHKHIQKALKTGQPVSVEDSSKESFTAEEKIICEQRGLLSIIYIPLIIEKKPVGTLILGTIKEHRSFTDAEIGMFRTISTPAALVIQNAKLYKKSQQFTEELKKQNDTILMMNEDLKQGYAQIKSMNQNLQEAKEAAEKSEVLKTVFLHNMSHEVRTPLNAISGFSQLLQNPSLSAEEVSKFSNHISKSSDRLLNIVTDILEVSKIQTRDLIIIESEFEFVSFVNFLISDFNSVASEKKIAFLTKFTPSIDEFYAKADSYKISKILHHLIDNALKFTESGTVEVQFNIKKDRVEFIVTDTGIGIRTEMQKQIFEPFQQIEPVFGNLYVGNGLGLTIVKAYTELLSGTLSLLSEYGKGTKVTIEIPVKRVSSLSLPSLEEPDLKKSGGAVLIVEDEETNYLYLKEVIADLYSNILYASNGRQAVEICRSEQEISVILMDINMPIMDGITAAAEIKKIRPNLRIIAQSAYATVEVSRNFAALTFDDYLTKPINKVDLIAKLRNIIALEGK